MDAADRARASASAKGTATALSLALCWLGLGARLSAFTLLRPISPTTRG